MSMRAAAGGGNGAAKSAGVKSPWSRTVTSSTAVGDNINYAKDINVTAVAPESDRRHCRPMTFADRFLELEAQTTSVSGGSSRGLQTQRHRSPTDDHPGERLTAGSSKNVNACSKRKSSAGATSVILDSCRSLIVPCVSIISAPLQPNEIDRSTQLVRHRQRLEEVDLSETTVMVEQSSVNETVVVLVNESNSGMSGMSGTSSGTEYSLRSDTLIPVTSDLNAGNRAVAARVADCVTRFNAGAVMIDDKTIAGPNCVAPGGDVAEMDDAGFDAITPDSNGDDSRYNQSTEDPSFCRVALETMLFRNQPPVTEFVESCDGDGGTTDERRLISDSCDATRLTSSPNIDNDEKRSRSSKLVRADEQTSPTARRTTTANADPGRRVSEESVRLTSEDATDANSRLELRQPGEKSPVDNTVRLRATPSIIRADTLSAVSARSAHHGAVLLIDGTSSLMFDETEIDDEALACPASSRLDGKLKSSTAWPLTVHSTQSSSPLSPAVASSNSQTDRRGTYGSVRRLVSRTTSLPKSVFSRPSTTRSTTGRPQSTKTGIDSSEEAAVTQFSSTLPTEVRASSPTWQLDAAPRRRDDSVMFVHTVVVLLIHNSIVSRQTASDIGRLECYLRMSTWSVGHCDTRHG